MRVCVDDVAVRTVQVLSRDRYRSRLPVDDDVPVPTLPALVHAAARLRSPASLHHEEPHGAVARRFAIQRNFTSLFTARRYASAVCSVSVCPSVRLPQASNVPKRLDVGSSKYRHTIAQELWFFMPKISEKFQWQSQRVRQTQVGQVKSAILNRCLTTTQKWCKIATYLLLLANSYALYWVLNDAISSNLQWSLNTPNHHNFYILRHLYCVRNGWSYRLEIWYIGWT